MRNDLNLSPIPTIPSTDGWKDVPISECNEQLVPLGFGSSFPRIFTDSIYVGARASSPYAYGELKHALHTPFLRLGAAQRLTKAATMLPDRHALLVWDSYRPLEVQGALFDDYVEFLIRTKSITREQAISEAQTFVSIPSTDPRCPSPHNTGGSIDLTVIRFTDWSWEKLHTPGISGERWHSLVRQASPLDMGTVFDAVRPETITRYYEGIAEEALTELDRERRANRRLLYQVMCLAGFTNYREEWWHFDYGNQFHSVRSHENAIYGAVALSKENLAFELKRRIEYEVLLASSDVVRYTTHPKAAKLSA